MGTPLSSLVFLICITSRNETRKRNSLSAFPLLSLCMEYARWDLFFPPLSHSRFHSECFVQPLRPQLFGVFKKYIRSEGSVLVLVYVHSISIYKFLQAKKEISKCPRLFLSHTDHVTNMCDGQNTVNNWQQHYSYLTNIFSLTPEPVKQPVALGIALFLDHLDTHVPV